MSRKKDLDYLTISARIHAMETRLLNAERVERMIEARELTEAAKVLTECGYEDLGQVTAQAMEETLAKAQESLFHDCVERAFCFSPEQFAVFCHIAAIV